MMTEKPIRVFVDGCFDLLHFGHANLIRQAKLMGDILVAGVHSDKEILKAKGPPVFNEQERYRMTRAIKWVDKVVEDTPYKTRVETLDEHDCDFYVHGNDVSYTADMVDSCAEVKAAGRFKECERTIGVSTTDLVDRLLLATKNNDPNGNSVEINNTISQFYPTATVLEHFSNGKLPGPSDKIVYVCGTFDLFHIGHLCFLEEARKWGDYMIVGIYSDETVRKNIDKQFPIMTLLERVLTVLAYRPVSEVIIGAPYKVTQDLIDRFRIDFVVQGIHEDHPSAKQEHDPYKVPKDMGIHRVVDSRNDMTTGKIVERIVDNRKLYEDRNKAIEAKVRTATKRN